MLIGVPILAILIAVFRDLDSYITEIRKNYSNIKKEEKLLISRKIVTEIPKNVIENIEEKVVENIEEKITKK